MQKLATLIVSVALLAISANAQIALSGDISTSMTLTSDNTYKLVGQVFVLPGATLTIEAGTVIASDPVDGGSLAITRGAQIIANGTKTNPVIFTSTNDVATWTPDMTHPTGGDPTTGTWREAANEWGNITIMGEGFISENAVMGNTPSCNASNEGLMEGLVEAFAGDPNVRYGGGDDDDDSGVLNHVSIRYGGRVVSLNNELNGLSLGGIGRGTDISHLEIMNNVDDGVEIWGGAVELKFISIWNIGDDSFDCDQGWRGKAQFVLIVQGYSLDASQGSGVGDNGVEIDGAEDSDYQPRTRCQIKNLTFIGQPAPGAGDGATAWRDGAGVQYEKCIFMDCGERVVRFDNDDGDGASGYGHNGTTSWANMWTTSAATTPLVNPCANPSMTYQAQDPSGNWCQMIDSVFWRNLASDAYTEATARGVTAVASNVIEPMASPIKGSTRGAPVVRGGKTMLPVIELDPRAANDAVTAALSNTPDSFFTPADWRGAFNANHNWLLGWSASSAFGFLTTPGGPIDENGWTGVAGLALLDVNDALNANGAAVDGSATGPFYSGLEAGDMLEISISGEGGQPFVLWSGDLNPGLIDYANNAPFIGKFDTGNGIDGAGIATGLSPLFDGFNPVTITDLLARIPIGGQWTLSYSGALLPPGFSFTLQGVANTSVPTASGFGIRLTNAVNVTVY